MARKVASRCESVRYCIEMYSSELCAAAAGKEKNAKRAGELYTVGFDFVCSEGKVFVELGDNSLMKREIDPEAFALLIFTSGTTSAAKGVMICNRNLGGEYQCDYAVCGFAPGRQTFLGSAAPPYLRIDHWLPLSDGGWSFDCGLSGAEASGRRYAGDAAYCDFSGCLC